MKAKYGGPMSIDDLYQALFQDREVFFEQHHITHVRNAYLYFTPCDELGEVVLIIDQLGNEIDGYVSGGAYRSAADAYEKAASKADTPATRPIVRQNSPASVPFSPL